MTKFAVERLKNNIEHLIVCIVTSVKPMFYRY